MRRINRYEIYERNVKVTFGSRGWFRQQELADSTKVSKKKRRKESTNTKGTYEQENN